jgi:hypothetical protein
MADTKNVLDTIQSQLTSIEEHVNNLQVRELKKSFEHALSILKMIRKGPVLEQHQLSDACTLNRTFGVFNSSCRFSSDLYKISNGSLSGSYSKILAANGNIEKRLNDYVGSFS